MVLEDDPFDEPSENPRLTGLSGVDGDGRTAGTRERRSLVEEHVPEPNPRTTAYEEVEIRPLTTVGLSGVRLNGDGEHLRQVGLTLAQRCAPFAAVCLTRVPQRNPPSVRDGDGFRDRDRERRVRHTPARDSHLFRSLVPEVVHEEDVTGGVPNHPVDRIAQHPRSKPKRFAFRDYGLDSSVGSEVDNRVFRVVTYDFVRPDLGAEYRSNAVR